MIELRPYQLGALEAIENALVGGTSKQLVALPTGTGKTVVFAELLKRRAHLGGALVLAHRDELLRQAADKIGFVAPELGLGVGFVQAGRNDVGAPIVVASVQTLARMRRLEQLPRAFSTLIVDEAHHAASDSYLRILEHVEAELVVGFTATPERHDKRRLEDAFDRIVFARSLLEMIEQGFLSNLRGIRVDLEVDLRTVKSSAGDFKASDLAEKLDDADVVPHCVESWLEHGDGRPTIAFATTVEHSKRIAAAFRARGVKAEHVDGEQDRGERRAILARLAAGETTIVSNVNVLTEGFDEPSIGCVLVATATKSRIRYVQMIGRGTRLYPGKSDCLILDLAGVTGSLRVESLPGLFGLEEEQLEQGELVTEGLGRRDRDDVERQEQAVKAAEGREVDLFARDRLRWLELDAGRWILDLADDAILLMDRGAAGDFRVVRIRRDGYRILSDGLDLGYAQGTAEAYVREQQALGLANRNASWRRRPPTEKQLALARKLKIATSSESRAGDLADAFAVKFSRGKVAKFDRAVGNPSTAQTPTE